MATVTNTRKKESSAEVSLDSFHRVPPRDLDAEKCTLGSILLLPDICDEVALTIRPEDFFDDAHQKIYRHMLDMHDNGQKIDHMLLIDHLKTAGVFEEIGGTAYLAEIAKAVPTAAHAKYYAQIVHDKAVVRSLIHSSTDILSDAYDETVEPRELLSRAEQRIFSILDEKGGGQLQESKDIILEAMARIDARMHGEGAAGGLPTGFTDYDNLCGGLHGSELLILAARPSMGKTALAMNIAEHVAMAERANVLFVSLEMSAIELGDRLLCSVARVNSHKMRTNRLSEQDHEKLTTAANNISNAPLFVDDSPSRTVTEIAAMARRLKRRENLGLIVIDYLQLIEPDNSSDPRQEQVAKIARRLKGMARELNVPVLCLAQLNRQAEATRDNKPRLSHLRESGAIEQDADVVMFVHREEYYQTNEDDRSRVAGEADLIIGKQRNGPTGDLKLTWLSDFTRFENAAPQPHEGFDDLS